MDKLIIPIISKSLVQSHRQCPRRAWIEARGAAEPDYGITGMAMLEQGQRVHAAARAMRPDAKLIPTHFALNDAAWLTAQAMAGGIKTIAEAVFVADGLGVRVDVLENDSDGLHIVEVKSGGGVKDEYLDDAAIQYACVHGAGHRVASVSIEHPSTTRVLSQGDPAGTVLARETVTDVVAARSVRVAGWVRECASTLAGPEPMEAPGRQCTVPHVCPFSARCGKVEVPTDTDRVEFLPSKAGKIKDCMEGGLTRISEMPPGAFTHERNALVREAVLRGVGIVRAKLADRVAALPYPRAFVDFETASPALPLHAGMRPFEPIPFQWSCHTEAAPQAQAAHVAFLDTSGRDPRRRFVESLLDAVGNAACVAVFSGYESRVLRMMAEAFPDLADRIQAVRGRLVDLLPLARRGYYHPEQRGSWSLKAILPTLPGASKAGFDYGKLDDVADGMQAQATYLRLVDARRVGVDANERVRLTNQLLRYCAIDTAGLLHFARHVESFAKHA